MGRFPWIVLLAVIALLVAAGCGGTERDLPSVGSPAEPTLLFLAGDGELTVVDVDAETRRATPGRRARTRRPALPHRPPRERSRRLRRRHVRPRPRPALTPEEARQLLVLHPLRQGGSRLARP